MSDSFEILPHPVYPVPTQAQAAANPEATAAYLLKRNERIELENADPYRYGFRPTIWERMEGKIKAGFREILLLGGNRASKSEYGGFKAVQTLLSAEKRRVWCLQSTEPNSVEMQQQIGCKYVP